FVPTGSGNLHIPRTILFGPDENLYVADEGINTVLRYDGKTGGFINNFTTGYTLDGPFGMAFGADDNLYVTTDQNDQVVRFNGNTGEFINEFLVNN
ncbi:MAG: PEP-CTERM sorting domain-containing protein, partial [Aliifodinibius sp.]|nr:PEP-CTERM sorting domain-containing protein [Phycisphaerae bacterium]NIR67023.1 PEP-CTERM sorting domain-containing protein [candidate division Zixibacteria bacterium]NIT57030.1 PEP-CTERM sorting domain-containing protein [Fodinibius sp.]NIW44900.1 PEP-CTERM sorting domain-containing protein [Gammaproteobacteria bacterium]NIS48444.1 PEP-CTERM sorting domain-containing protein [candidate division Zixibacteria bacterium]